MSYCSVNDLAGFGYSINDETIPILERICVTASNRVEAYCHQRFTLTKGAKEKHLARAKNGRIAIFPKNLVVNAINIIDFMPMWKTKIKYEIKDYIYDESNAVIVGETNAPNGEYIVTLNYDYGYPDSEIPSDLIQATAFMAIPLLDDYFSASETGVSGLKMLQQGKLKIERGAISSSAKLDEATGFPLSAISLLNGGGYVRVRGDYL